METRHTYGPWKVKHSESKYAFNVIGTRLGGKYKIARCPYVVTGDRAIDEVNRAEAEANARLIAAAPEMYESLKEAERTIRSLKLSMMAHPDHEEGSEFDDMTTKAQEMEDKIKTLLQKATES